MMATIQHILPLLLILPLIAAWNPVLRSIDLDSIRRAGLMRKSQRSSDLGVDQRNDLDEAGIQRAFAGYFKSLVANHGNQQRSDPCRLNLGGRCATEMASELVKAWHYLNSSHGPGRKRRDVREALRTILRRSTAAEAVADTRL